MPTLAPPPTRSTIGFTLQWGLVPVPIRLFTAFEDTNPVKRSMFTKAGNKVGMPKVDTATGQTVASDDVQFMVEVDGKLVELTDEETAEVTSDFDVNRGSVEIQFVPAALVGGRYQVDKTYQARSGLAKVGTKSVPDPHADKTFALLLQSMAKKKVACLFRASLKGPARFAALTPDGRVHFLFYDGEVREQFDWPEVTISKGEAAQGLELIELIGVTEPDLVDERGEALMAFLARKVKDGKGLEIKADSGAGGQVLDLTAALEASVAAAKAPKTTAKRKAS